MSFTANGILFGSDVVGGEHKVDYKIGFGPTGSFTYVSPTAPLPVRVINIAAAGAAHPFRTINLLAASQSVKASAGSVRKIVVQNRSTAARAFKIYDKATSVNAAADVPVHVIWLEGSASAVEDYAGGWAFANGIQVRACTGIADADNTAPTANDIVCSVWFD